MKIAVCYVYANLKAAKHVPAAKRFVQSYLVHPPGETDHELWVLVNGSPLSPSQKKLFDALPFHFLDHDNSGMDIGAFQKAGVLVNCDLLVCFGGFVHFCWTGWLDRMARVYEDNGPALYGGWGFHQPRIHIRTTAFWLPRELFNSYPLWIGNAQRYEFEHGKKSITQHVVDLKLPTLMVTRTRVLDLPHWTHVPEPDCLLLDQHTDRIGYSKT